MNYNIQTDTKHIYITPRTGDEPYIFTKNDILMEILCSQNLTAGITHGKRHDLYFWINTIEGRVSCYGYDLAFLSYYDMISTVSLPGDIGNFSKYKRSQRLEVDHLDTNPYNNTIHNLSLMTGAHNKSKQQLTARFVPPYYFVSSFSNGEYRLLLAFKMTHHDVVRTFGLENEGGGWCCMGGIFSEPKALINFLRSMQHSRFWWCKPNRTPKDCFTGNVYAPIHAQEALAKMDMGRFMPFVSGE